MEKSLWLDSVELPKYESLTRNINTDVLIIGGGLCGLLCAYTLINSGINCIVVESNQIASGTSGHTTAKITSLHGLLYHELSKKQGLNAAKAYYQANQKAIHSFEQIALNADCDFKRTTAYTYSLNSKEKIEKEYRTLKAIGAKAELKTDSPLPFAIAGAVGLKNQAQFNPLKFIQYIIKDLKIYENTRITKISDGTAYFHGGKINAKKIIVATHFPFEDKHGLYFLKLYQHRSYVLALENAQSLDGMYVDENDSGLSFRNYGDLLLLGGGGGRTGKPCGAWNELIQFKNQYYPNSKIKYQWATQDCISLDKLPLIGQYSLSTPNLYTATGFNKWGMTTSMVAAQLLTDAILGIYNPCDPYSKLFSPSRSILKPQLLINCAETLSNYISPTTKRCPHLGCALKWNPHEHSWDCPCHGSRFEKNGKLLNNPANKNMT